MRSVNRKQGSRVVCSTIWEEDELRSEQSPRKRDMNGANEDECRTDNCRRMGGGEGAFIVWPVNPALIGRSVGSALLSFRLMVRRQTLNLHTVVRIHQGQPNK